jgi:hypothetical protein
MNFLQRFLLLFGALAVISTVAFVACKQPCSKVIGPASTKIFDKLGQPQYLNCKHPEVLAKKFVEKCASIGLCKDDQPLAGPIAMIVCPIAIPLIIQGGVLVIPPEAECSPNTAPTEAGLIALCNLIPF